jgi:hypothetical protein
VWPNAAFSRSGAKNPLISIYLFIYLFSRDSLIRDFLMCVYVQQTDWTCFIALFSFVCVFDFFSCQFIALREFYVLPWFISAGRPATQVPTLPAAAVRRPIFLFSIVFLNCEIIDKLSSKTSPNNAD